MGTRHVDFSERTDRMARDLMGGLKPEALAAKYGLSLPHIRKLLRDEGRDHLLDGAKPRERSRRQDTMHSS